MASSSARARSELLLLVRAVQCLELALLGRSLARLARAADVVRLLEGVDRAGDGDVLIDAAAGVAADGRGSVAGVRRGPSARAVGGKLFFFSTGGICRWDEQGRGAHDWRAAVKLSCCLRLVSRCAWSCPRL